MRVRTAETAGGGRNRPVAQDLQQENLDAIGLAPWAVATSLVLSVAGLGVSLYLTVAHFVGSHALVCSANGLINCEKVTSSAQSHFLGAPVAVLGLAFYLVMVGVNLPWVWRVSDRRVHIARMALIGGGMAFALYLVGAELLIIGNICVWCTAVHVVTFLLFVLIVTVSPNLFSRRDDRGGLSAPTR